LLAIKTREKYNEAFPNGEIEELNLYEGLLPRLDSEQLLNVWNKLGAGTPLSEEEQQVDLNVSLGIIILSM
jgi:FMN-dependent NADH-azoreductase